MEITDELVELINSIDMDENAYTKMFKMTCRIGREMIELPRDRNGVPINVGDTAYLPSGDVFHVVEIIYTKEGICIKCKTSGATFHEFTPFNVSHEYPDSWERIMDDLKELSVNSDDKYHISTTHRMMQLADRIRKLSEKEKCQWTESIPQNSF